jgi:hypothetical protein
MTPEPNSELRPLPQPARPAQPAIQEEVCLYFHRRLPAEEGPDRRPAETLPAMRVALSQVEAPGPLSKPFLYSAHSDQTGKGFLGVQPLRGSFRGKRAALWRGLSRQTFLRLPAMRPTERGGTSFLPPLRAAAFRIKKISHLFWLLTPDSWILYLFFPPRTLRPLRLVFFIRIPEAG